MGLKEEFEEHAEKINKLTTLPSNDDLLIIYGLYKQATVGDVNTSRPGMFDLKGKAKWDAWEKCKGKTKDQAMEDYITKAKEMLEKYTASA